jgi:hypothetical protein
MGYCTACPYNRCGRCIHDCQSPPGYYGDNRKYGNVTGDEGYLVTILCQSIEADFKLLREALDKSEAKSTPGHLVRRGVGQLKSYGDDHGFEMFRESTADQSILEKRPDGVKLLNTELGILEEPFLLVRVAGFRAHLRYLYEGLRVLILRKLEKE